MELSTQGVLMRDSTERLRPIGQRGEGGSREKPLSFRLVGPVPETDTGGRGEHPKALE